MSLPANVVTLGDLLAAFDGAAEDTPVVTDQAEILMTPVPGYPLPDSGDYVELTVAPVPAMPGEVQTVAAVRDLFTQYTTQDTTVSGAPGTPARLLGTGSPLLLAPFGGEARWLTGVQSTERGFVLTGTPM